MAVKKAAAKKTAAKKTVKKAAAKKTVKKVGKEDCSEETREEDRKEEISSPYHVDTDVFGWRRNPPASFFLNDIIVLLMVSSNRIAFPFRTLLMMREENK